MGVCRVANGRSRCRCRPIRAARAGDGPRDHSSAHVRQPARFAVTRNPRHRHRLERLQRVHRAARGFHLHGGPAREGGDAAWQCPPRRHGGPGVRVLPDQQGPAIAERLGERPHRRAVGPHPAVGPARHQPQPPARRRHRRARAQPHGQRARGPRRGPERHHLGHRLGGARHHAVRRGRGVPRRGPGVGARPHDDHVRRRHTSGSRRPSPRSSRLPSSSEPVSGRPRSGTRTA